MSAHLSRHLVVGRGRLATHLLHYLRAEGLAADQWHRGEDRPVEAAADPCDRVVLAIADGAIEPFVAAHPALRAKTLVHCAGGLATPVAHAAHPLNTFAGPPYPAEDYRATAFVVDAEGPGLAALLPGLRNPAHPLPAALRVRYHAACVLAGNCTTLLWQRFHSVLETELGLPRAAAAPYLRRLAANLSGPAVPALTGPLARGDAAAVARHLAVLAGGPDHGIYLAFVRAHAPALLPDSFR